METEPLFQEVLEWLKNEEIWKGGGQNTEKTKQLNKKIPTRKFPNHKTTLQDMKHIPSSERQGLWTTYDSACI